MYLFHCFFQIVNVRARSLNIEAQFGSVTLMSSMNNWKRSKIVLQGAVRYVTDSCVCETVRMTGLLGQL